MYRLSTVLAFAEVPVPFCLSQWLIGACREPGDKEASQLSERHHQSWIALHEVLHQDFESPRLSD
jgi:hypothetical protein